MSAAHNKTYPVPYPIAVSGLKSQLFTMMKVLQILKYKILKQWNKTSSELQLLSEPKLGPITRHRASGITRELKVKSLVHAIKMRCSWFFTTISLTDKV